MSREVWVLGATGRTGRAIASRLDAVGVELVLLGRDRSRLEQAAQGLDYPPRSRVGTLKDHLRELARSGSDAPGVVVNTVGPFTRTAAQVASACPPGTHYVDVSNELFAAQQILDLDPAAKMDGRTLVTGAGFGVLATESVVLHLCAGRPRSTWVRTDALAAVALEDGVVGAALAATIVEVVATGGYEVRAGRLVRAAAAAHGTRLVTPDGDSVYTGSGANAELLAAWRASGADAVVAGSPAAPDNRIVRAVLPAMSAMLRPPSVGRLATRAIARIPLKAKPMARAFSFGHATVQWADGEVREGWLRAPDGTDFTSAVAALVTQKLLSGDGAPGAYTPGALFGPDLAVQAGGVFIDADAPTQHDTRAVTPTLPIVDKDKR